MKFPITALALSLTTASSTKFTTDSPAGRHLLSRSLNENNGGDFDFIADYSIKFLGCHHVQQWNDYADEENDVRIMTKRLVRFRLCETESCSNDKSAGCTSKFGDYVADMDVFLESYLQMIQEDENVCGDAANDCADACGGNDDDCMTSCYDQYELSYCYEQQNNNNGGFNLEDFAGCQEVNLGGRRRLEDQQGDDDDDVAYFIGAFCADQGGEIHLGLFTDDTCTTFANNGYSLFKSTMGYTLPYSESSLVTTRCLSCSQQDGDGNNEVSETCTNTYELSGKCETRMNVDYPNESSCNYIEGIKIIREDGVIRTTAVKQSKAAAIGIGLFCTAAVLLFAYVAYLRTKLARAQINLAASTQALT